MSGVCEAWLGWCVECVFCLFVVDGCRGAFVFDFVWCNVTLSIVSVPERSKGVDSSSTVFALVGSNPTADTISSFTHHD